MVMCVILCVWVLYLTYEVPSIFLSAVIVGVGMSNRRCDDYIHRSVTNIYIRVGQKQGGS